MLSLRSLRSSFMPISFLMLSLMLHTRADHNHPSTFIFDRFNGSSNLILINDASVTSNVLRLTNHSRRMIGRALYSTPVQIKNNNTLSSFGSTFVFSMVPPQGPGGHGIAFVMTPFKSLMGALEGQYLGLLNASSNGHSYNHLFAVEFDTNQRAEFGDFNDNHVGVDINSLQSLEPKTAGYWVNAGKKFQELSLKSGQNIQAWIQYDHLQKELNVTITLAGLLKPSKPLLSVKEIDLSAILQEQMYVGFSAATGFDCVEDHYILAWSFNSNGTVPPALDLSHLPSFTHTNSKHLSTEFIAGITVASLVVLFVAIFAVYHQFKRRKYTELFEEWELEYWPHRISYPELSIATKGFQDEQLLGSGGFGRVYKGVLPTSGLEVAVKCIIKDSTEGMKEFIAEISSVGRLRHRNLVQLRGWCRKDTRLFIVYDHMPNGSLDKMIFGNPETVLRWPERYRILKGIAAGLLYLHEQWDRIVVHRDVKPSNVLLDSDLNAKLGDFGLARLTEHNKSPDATLTAGTMGYLAPEYLLSGKASDKTDVFSFGAVVLEVACGRRPIEKDVQPGESNLVDWVWSLHRDGKLLEAADARLEGEFEKEEMKRMLLVGLLCSHPDSVARPTMRQVLQILNGEISLPFVPSFKPSVSFSSNLLLSLHDIVSESGRSQSSSPSSASFRDQASA